MAYATRVPGDGVNGLGNDPAFYERFAYKVLAAEGASLAATYSLSLALDSVYFPWNRTFEIGLVARA